MQTNESIYRVLTAYDLFGAIIAWGADPMCIDSYDIAHEYANIINQSSRRGEVQNDYADDPEYGEFAVSMQQLGLTPTDKPQHIFTFVNGSYGLVCFAGDYE